MSYTSVLGEGTLEGFQMLRKSISSALTMALVIGLAAVALEAAAPAANASVAPQLTRYPYLTDVVLDAATINWATDRSATTGSLTYGRVGSESCTAHKVSASKTAITVKTTPEYQWKAKLTGLLPNTRYCYRILLGSTDLLGSDPSPQFWSQIPAGSTTPFSFAVLGDWGDTDANGNNPSEAALMSSLASSGVRFVLGAGDTAYDSGTQANYGDLQQSGYRVSSVFGPNFWAKVGATTPLFNAEGNHGATATFLNTWPQARAVSSSGGKYQMDTYCCLNGTNSFKGPSAWYAFDAGNARFYILTTSWPSSNVGTSTEYGDDYAYRWQKTSPEYQWLKSDLQSHPSQLKFAVFHYPLYSDNATETSDTYLQGTQSLEGLLSHNGVDIAFNGHAHVYQRNAAAPGGLVSYITGGGGGLPEPITKCKTLDQFGLGWSQTKGGSSCGGAPKPTQVEQVYHYLKVDVNGSHVTVSGMNALGQIFDVVTYDFTPDTTPPTAPTNLQATAVTGARVDLTWTASSDANGVTAYDIYRDGSTIPLASVAGTQTAYSDTSVSPQTQYSYIVKARDAANNVSDPSNTASVTTPALDTEAPSAPTNLHATAISAQRVDLSWTASTDNVGVTAYDIYRNGGATPIASVPGNVTAYSDTSVAASTQYGYTVRARDAVGNSSGDSNVAQATTPSIAVLFMDDFESGTLSSWTSVSGLTVDPDATAPSGGAWVAHESSGGAGGTYAYRSISPTVSEVYAKFAFKVNSRTGSVDLMRLRNSTGGSKFSLLVSGATNTLAARNSAGTTVKSNATIVNGTWYTVEVHIANATNTTEVWLDGVHLTELDATGSVGSTAVGQFLLGNTGTGTYDVVFDDAIAAKQFI